MFSTFPLLALQDPQVDCYQTSQVQTELHLSRENLVGLAILLGCDYIPKVGREDPLKSTTSNSLTLMTLCMLTVHFHAFPRAYQVLVKNKLLNLSRHWKDKHFCRGRKQNPLMIFFPVCWRWHIISVNFPLVVASGSSSGRRIMQVCLRELWKKFLTATYVDILVSGSLLWTLTLVSEPNKRWKANW